MRSQDSRWWIDAFAIPHWASDTGDGSLGRSRFFAFGGAAAAGASAAVAALPLALRRAFGSALSSIPFPRFDIRTAKPHV